jgi:hypothetical protein
MVEPQKVPSLFIGPPFECQEYIHARGKASSKIDNEVMFPCQKPHFLPKRMSLSCL